MGPSGVGKCAERGVDTGGGLVAIEQVAQLGAGEPVGAGGERGADLFGEGVAGGGGDGPVDGARRVVPQGHPGAQMGGADCAAAVDERVEQSEAQHVRFCSGGERAGGRTPTAQPPAFRT